MKAARKPWIDQLRALAMAFVIIGHACPGVKWFFTWTSPVKIPLFFVLSGYLFRAEGYSGFGEFAKAKARRLLVPYFALSAICQAVGAFSDVLTGAPLREAAMRYAGIFTGETMWFVPCLFIVEIALYGISRLKGTARVISGAAAFLVGIGATALFEPLPFRPGTALFMTGFAHLGLLLRRMDDREINWRRAWAMAGLGAVYAASVILQDRFGAINVNTGKWPCIPLNIISCAAGCALLAGIFPKLPAFGPMQWIGKNTLVLYAFHTLALSALRFGLKAAGIRGMNGSFLWGMALSLGAGLICAGIAAFINRFCPEIAGGRRVVRRTQ